MDWKKVALGTIAYALSVGGVLVLVARDLSPSFGYGEPVQCW